MPVSSSLSSEMVLGLRAGDLSGDLVDLRRRSGFVVLGILSVFSTLSSADTYFSSSMRGLQRGSHC